MFTWRRDRPPLDLQRLSRTRGNTPAFRVLILAGILLAAGSGLGHSQEAQYNEYQVKAAFISNFAKFIDWPQAPPAEGAIPQAFCIIGADPFGPNVESLRGKSLPGTELTLTRIASLTEARGCRLLYISASEQGRLGTILQALAGSPVLTIADIEGGARQGVMINFYLEQEMVRFEINAEALRRAGLTARAKLLKLARIVR